MVKLNFIVNALLVVMTLSAVSFAATYVDMDDRALLNKSALVVVGEVVDISNESKGDGIKNEGAIVTDYSILVLDVLKGDISDNVIKVQVLGGLSADGTYLFIDGAPQFNIGDEAILFLNPYKNNLYRIAQFMLGAFLIYELEDGTLYAERNILDNSEITITARKNLEKPPKTLRRFNAFTSWIRDEALGLSRIEDYWFDTYKSKRKNSISEKYTLFSPAFRWFEFDTLETVNWHAGQPGQDGVSGGGITEFQNAISAWVDDTSSNVFYSYAGTTTSTIGFSSSDGINAIIFNDPNDEIDGSFDCNSGGTLAIGGSFYSSIQTYNGQPFRTAVEGAVVVQDNVACFFNDYNGKNAEEVLAHELGHTLGVGHTTDNTALMYPYAHGDGRGGQLAQDDIDGITYLYPAPTPTPTPTPVVCTYTISPQNKYFESEASTGSIDVTASDPSCSWNASTNDTFLSITSGTESATGSGKVDYSITENTDASFRTGTITAAGQTLFITQTAASCTTSVIPTSAGFTSNGGTGAIVITVPDACSWYALSNNSFITLTEPTSGTDNATISYTVSANSSTDVRAGVLDIAGNFITIHQAGTTVTFDDVSESDIVYPWVETIYDYGITSGCDADSYCPNNSVTRGQMAVFIIRSMIEKGIIPENFTYSATPYFTDVSAEHIFFSYIQKLKETGVTAGCSATEYCPDAAVTREMMAVFITKAIYGSTPVCSSGVDCSTTAPYFDDVTTDMFSYSFIQKFKEIGITSGCSTTSFCPTGSTTRGQMAIFLTRGFLE
ncbi:secreted protein containing Peptidase M10A and M12B, matrixin and adamalysin domain protein [Candidatus Magnetoovum chiemensis]|nr:secreted protein containing Peptidase M10A and M12B, matrixin and adamalysin domain protein [Candidatus Magnetoovum chiemensis]